MTRPMVRIHDLSTNIITDREMNDTEFAQYEVDQVAAEARNTAEAEAEAAAVVAAEAEETAKQQAFNDAVSAAVASALAAQQP